MSKKVTDTVQEMAQPIVDSLQLELVDIEFVKEGQSWFLRVFIDSDDGVDIEECAKVSEASLLCRRDSPPPASRS